MNKVLDFLMKIVFLVCACISIAAVITICVFMFANGVPAIKEIGITKFLFGTQWRVSQNLFGIWPMIVGSIYVTAGAMIIGVPIGLLTAVFLAKYCPKKLYKFIKPIINLMAGIPSTPTSDCSSSFLREQAVRSSKRQQLSTHMYTTHCSLPLRSE